MVCALRLLHKSDEYFPHTVGLGASTMFWARASSSRKELRGIQQGVDNTPPCSSFVHVVTRIWQYSIMACAVHSWASMFRMKQVDRPMSTHALGFSQVARCESLSPREAATSTGPCTQQIPIVVVPLTQSRLIVAHHPNDEDQRLPHGGAARRY